MLGWGLLTGDLLTICSSRVGIIQVGGGGLFEDSRNQIQNVPWALDFHDE